MRRRWVRVTAIVAVLLVGAVALAWVNWPHYRPALGAGESYGIDVSAHQGPIDWQAVHRDGIDAVYVKASEGGEFRDRTFVDNWEGAAAAGLSVGAYHFFTLCRDGAEQASNFLSRLEQVDALPTSSSPTDASPEDASPADASPADASGGASTAPGRARILPPAIDLELSGNCSDRPPVATVNARLTTLVSRVEAATGQRVRLYVIDTYESRYPLPKALDRDRWTRRLGLRPDGPWSWWQVHDEATVDGIEGPVDLNVVRRDPSD